MRTASLAFVVACGLVVASGAELQSQVFEPLPAPGHAAMIGSPIGSLPPYLSRDQFIERGSPYVIHIRYGLRKADSSNTHTAGLTAEFPVSFGRIGTTLGLQRRDSATSAMVGMEFQSMMSRGALTPNPEGMLLVLAIKTEMGFGTIVDGELESTVFSGGMSINMTVPFGREIMIVPFLTPGIGFGLESTGGTTEFEPQMMLAGGIVIHNPSRFDFTLAGHRTLADGARTIYGIGLTWNR